MKKWIGLLLLIILIALTVCAGAETVGGSTYFTMVGEEFGREGIDWSLDLLTGKMTISGSGSMGEYIRLGVLYRPWENKFRDWHYLSDIKSLVIEEGITDIAPSAFSGCTNLKSVSLPSTLTKIGSGAFNGCTALTSITIPDGVTFIGEEAFRGCSSLVSAKLSSSLTSIGKGAFYECKLLPTITIPSGVQFIGESAFRGCVNLVGTVETYGSIENTAFYETSISKAVIHNCTNIDEGAFGKCKNLQSVTIDSEIEVIPAGLFAYDSALISVNIPDSVVIIGKQAFEDCSSLKSLKLPPKLNSIGDLAFAGSGLTSLTIPDSVETFGIKMFSTCKKLQTVTLPSGLTLLPESTFSGCTSLQKVTIPAGVTLIEKWAFSSCDNLTQITLPDGLVSIGEYAFNYSGLLRISLPDSLTAMGYAAFSGSDLLSVDIPSTVAALPESCFSNCSSLASVTLSDSIVSIPDGAFRSCKALTSIKLPNSIVSIGSDAFAYSNLVTVSLPKSLTVIDQRAFIDCPIKTVKYAGTEADWNEINIADGNEPLIKAYNSGSEDEAPTLSKVSFSAEKAAVKEKVTITAVTNTSATKLIMYNGSKEIQSWTEGYTDDDDVRTWKVTCTFAKAGARTMSFTAADKNGAESAAKTASITITKAASGLTLDSVKFAKKKATVKQKVTINAVTSTTATKLIMYSGDKEIQSWTKGYTDKDGKRTWKVTCIFAKAGARTMSFKAADKNGKLTAAKSAKITITKAPTLSKVSLSTDKAKRKKTFTITAVTSTNVTKLTMYLNGKVAMTWTEGYTDKSGKRVWKVTYSFSKAGKKTLTFKGVDANGAATAGKDVSIEIVK